MPGVRSVLIMVVKKVFINDLHSEAGGRERPLSNSDHLLVSSASPTELYPNMSVAFITAFSVVTSVQTNFQQIAERQFVSVVSDADNVNHIVIFMTGQILFPDGFAGLTVVVITGFVKQLLYNTYPMSGKVATEEWLVRNVEGEVSPRFFSLSTSLSHSPPALFTFKASLL
ncbi:hypothetical protein J6590_068060 [Homalodisca vitripennis]|nr:hypothetical protein J6590_068060 [Homalodisca vitripennis]